MAKNYQIDNEEINLIELMLTVWKGKWKIAVAVVISFIAAISYQSYQATNNFTARTEIKPAKTLEINKYFFFNYLLENADDKKINAKTTKITSSILLNLYLDILRDKSVFEDAIRKFNLLDASQYNNDQKYNEAISKLASSIKILPPLNDKENLEVDASYHTINFIHDDKEKWKNVLKYSNELANKLVQQILNKEYKTFLSTLKKKYKHQIEDLSVQINNVVSDYDRETYDRLAYLSEQSEIAWILNIAKNTIGTQSIGNENQLLSNLTTESPFYLRGYKAIDKEVELLSKRTNKKPFMSELFELEKKKRKIEQNKIVERVELELQSTPLGTNGEFFAASTNITLTKFEYKDTKRALQLAIVIGLIVGIIYVVISSSFKSQTVSRKRN